MLIKVLAVALLLVLVACEENDGEQAADLVREMRKAGVRCQNLDIVIMGPMYSCSLKHGSSIDMLLFDDEQEAKEVRSTSPKFYRVWGDDYVLFLRNSRDAHRVADALDAELQLPASP